MWPLKDDIPSRSTPLVTIVLVVLNGLVFAYQFSLQTGGATGAAEAFILEFGLSPCRLTASCRVGGPSPALTVLTSMFLHGGLLHVAGNMLYLWIFGDNVEDAFGHGRFLVFYLACGVAAAFTQVMAVPESRTPMVGASGAVAGVLGAYLVLFPHARVLTVLIIVFFVRLVYIPAVVVLGFWIVIQIINGWLAVVEAGRGEAAGAGVAWFAHIGGFVAGLILLFIFRPSPRRLA
jgi:membrane associated rhomboid family serine protease